MVEYNSQMIKKTIGLLIKVQKAEKKVVILLPSEDLI
ncbi:hypothetical protein M670_04594 [Schinkia azotoformans MEV2011]|uniref:Uncharacterized protein n=1 Tax=Schinkia azotoformans MEV2011 TaxID=1348973 RepID=A0A072NH51_SCHAZ|nr:hypothetical protein M670_04594 [Schinkia azotoformans MEV2011]